MTSTASTGSPRSKMKLIGDWTPGNFSILITLAAKLTLLIIMMTRGLDYYTGDTADTARRLQAIESAAPLWFWGAACIFGASIGFIGVIFRRALPILWSHVIGAALYGAFATGIVIDVVERVDNPWKSGTPALILFMASAVFIALACGFREYMITFIAAAAACLGIGLGVLSVGLDGIRSGTILYGISFLHILFTIGTAAYMSQQRLRKEREAHGGG